MFPQDQPITLGSDFVALFYEAVRYENKYGRDLGNGWLLRHPLTKLSCYQVYRLDSNVESEGEEEMVHGKGDDEEDGNKKVRISSKKKKERAHAKTPTVLSSQRKSKRLKTGTPPTSISNSKKTAKNPKPKPVSRRRSSRSNSSSQDGPFSDSSLKANPNVRVLYDDKWYKATIFKITEACVHVKYSVDHSTEQIPKKSIVERIKPR